MVNELATLGSDPNQLNEFGEAPLCVAAYKAQGLVVEELLQRQNIQVSNAAGWAGERSTACRSTSRANTAGLRSTLPQREDTSS